MKSADQQGESGLLLGESTAMQAVKRQLREVAATDLTVLLLGETGTGKGMAARLLHAGSRRAKDPFVAVDCGALLPGLIDSELFGHERGAFTGAIARRLGKCERADHGTLFLYEVGDLPLEFQTRLLRLLQKRVFERVGGTRTFPLDVRIIAATHRDLARAAAEERFRADLYYRLNVFPIWIPPLRERREDIGLLARHFASGQSLSAEALALLQGHNWPGNVRELEHAVQRAAFLAKGGEIRPEHLFLESSGESANPVVVPTGPFLPLAEYERQYLVVFQLIIMSKPPAPPGDSQSLTVPEIKESLPIVNRSKPTERKTLDGNATKFTA